MNATTYRLVKVVRNLVSTIDTILENKVYYNDVNNNVKTELRNTINDLRHILVDYTESKKIDAVETHTYLAHTRLRLSALSDKIIGLQFFDDRQLIMSTAVFDLLTTLRQVIYILMQQISMTEL